MANINSSVISLHMDIWFYQHWLSGNDIFREVETMKMTHHNQIRLFCVLT